jgi:hypothetical protein
VVSDLFTLRVKNISWLKRNPCPPAAPKSDAGGSLAREVFSLTLHRAVFIRLPRRNQVKAGG